jgi:hypothetical protein
MRIKEGNNNKMKCDNCGLDLTGTTLNERLGAANLCLPCYVIDKHKRKKIK